VEKQVEKEPDIKEFVEKKSLLEDHSESPGFPGDTVLLTTSAASSANNGNIGTKLLYRPGHFMNPLIVTDAVGDREGGAM
jgi:hypothetical protein